MKTQIVIIGLFLYMGCIGKNEKSTFKNTKSNADVEVAIESVERLKKVVEPTKNSDDDLLDLTLQENRKLEDYKKNVLLFSKLGIRVQTTQVESIIPINDDEYGYFYSLSYPEEYPESNLDLYYEMEELMLDYANEDKGNCLFLYSNLAEFVDGEYADFYFEAMEAIAKNNIDEFCNVIYNSLSDTSKKRLEYIYIKHCKSVH